MVSLPVYLLLLLLRALLFNSVMVEELNICTLIRLQSWKTRSAIINKWLIVVSAEYVAI